MRGGELEARVVDRRRLRRERAVPHVTHHADDGVLSREISLAMEHAAERIGVAPESLRRRLADDDDQRRGGGSVGVEELAPAQQRDVHRLEVARAHDAPVGRHRGVRREAATARSSRSASSCSCRCRTGCRSTPRRRARPASRAATRAACDRTRARVSGGYVVAGSASWNVSRRSGSNPRLTCCSRSRLCVRSPAPISRIVASASSAAARPLRRRGRAPLDARVACFKHLVQVGLRGVPRRRDAEEQSGHDRQARARTAGR